MNTDNQRRIAACLSACEGFDTEYLEHCHFDSGYTPEAKYAELKAKHDALVSALNWSDKQIADFICVAFRHAEIKGDFRIEDVRDALKLIMSKAAAK